MKCLVEDSGKKDMDIAIVCSSKEWKTVVESVEVIAKLAGKGKAKPISKEDVLKLRRAIKKVSGTLKTDLIPCF